FSVTYSQTVQEFDFFRRFPRIKHAIASTKSPHSQPQDGQGEIANQTITDENGVYIFQNVPSLTSGDTYTVVACVALAEGDGFTGNWTSILPDPAGATIVNIYMTPSVADCEF
ncbi:MAG: hypothetical protein ACI9EW_001936, partial [Cellvibrionaceae bacterium]